MLKITKNEAFYMRNAGFDNLVKHSYTRHKTYFLVEEREAIRKLNEYRKSKIVQ